MSDSLEREHPLNIPLLCKIITRKMVVDLQMDDFLYIYFYLLLTLVIVDD